MKKKLSKIVLVISVLFLSVSTYLVAADLPSCKSCGDEDSCKIGTPWQTEYNRCHTTLELIYNDALDIWIGQLHCEQFEGQCKVKNGEGQQ